MTTGEQYDQWMAEAWGTNVKAMFDQHLRDAEREREQVNDWHAFGLEQARTNAQIVNRLAQENATLGTRIANNHATFDSLIFAGEIDTTAQGVAAAKLTEEFRSVAKQAVEAAVAAVPGTSAASQGTTGVAQGAMQGGIGVADAAILAQIAKLAEAVNVLYVKVLGEEVVTEG